MPEESNAQHIQIIPPGVKKWGKVILEAHGCVLLQNFTGKRYTYRVVDMKTGAEAYICHKPQPVHDSECEGMIQKFLSSRKKSDPKYCADVKREEYVTHDNLAETIEHIFREILPEHGYSLRTEQMELAKHILEALRSRMVSLSEAGVGIGKTHAYLIAAAVIKRRRINDFWLRGNYPNMAYAAEMPMVVATSSIALQKAIVKDYIPEISKILMKHGVITKPLTCAIRKGKEHYICDKRLSSFYYQSRNRSEKRILKAMLKSENGIDLDEMDSLKPYIKRRISVMGRCGAHCELKDSCRYMAFLKNAQSDKHDFQICNHNYLLADVIHRAKGQKALIPDYQAVIIDEAHKFTQATRSMYGTELSSFTLPRIAKTVRSLVFTQGHSTADLLRDSDMLDGHSKYLFQLLNKNIPDIYDDEAERFKTSIDGTVVQHLRTIRKTINALAYGLEERQVIQKYKSQYFHLLWELEEVWEQISSFENHGSLIYWLEKPDGLFSVNRNGTDETLLCAIPKNLGDMLRADLWSKGVPTILTSGTLSASGDFTHVKLGMGLDKLKLDKIMETSKPSPFNYRENALIYISNAVPFPDNKDSKYIMAVADEVERLIMTAHGHTAALFTSYRVMEAVYDILKTRNLPFPMFMMGRGSVNTIEQFRQSGNGVLFAAGSMWEGIDLPGDILSMLILVKLPFAVPDPINEYEQTRFASFGEYKNFIIIPEMIVKLIQGFGRLLRSEYDTGVVALLDYRVREDEAYHDRVLFALPGCRVTYSIGEVGLFLLEKKNQNYFLLV